MTTPATQPPQPPNEDFLEVPASAVSPDALPGVPARRGIANLTTAGWLVAGVAAGAIGVVAFHSGGSSAATTAPAAANGVAPGSQGAGGSGGGAFGGGAFGGGPGRIAGEQHIVGTLASVSASSLTVTTGSGTSTYTIDSSTLLVKDGQRVSSLSAMTTGDPVVVHVYPQGGSTRVELVLDGPPSGGIAPPDDGHNDQQGTTTTT